MKSLIKYIITWLIISIVGGVLFYLLYPFFTKETDHTNYFKSALAVGALTSFITYVFYTFLFNIVFNNRKFNMFIKCVCCFILVILFWTFIGSVTFGFPVKGLLFIALSLGISNTTLPYLDRYLYFIIDKNY